MDGQRSHPTAKCFALVCVAVAGLAQHPQTAIAQQLQSSPGEVSQQDILERLERTERLLQQTQDELHLLEQRDAQRHEWEQTVIERLPPYESGY